MFYGTFDASEAGTMRRRTLLGAMASAAVLLVVVAVVSQGQQQEGIVLFGMGGGAIDVRIWQDEQRLQRDLAIKRQMQMQALATYPDGCKCETSNCNTPNCDEENSDGPLCKCPDEMTRSLPGAATPWPMDAKFRGRAAPSLRQLSPLPIPPSSGAPHWARGGAHADSIMPPYTGGHAQARAQQPVRAEHADGVYMPPYLGARRARGDAASAERGEGRGWGDARARRQWAGARSAQLRVVANQDERVPAQNINPGLFTGSRAGGPTLHAFESLV